MIRIQVAPAFHRLNPDMQIHVVESLSDACPSIVCEAHPHILQTLADIETADTILPKRFLSLNSLSRRISFPDPQYYYLLKVHHSGRTLPLPVKDLLPFRNCVPIENRPINMHP